MKVIKLQNEPLIEIDKGKCGGLENYEETQKPVAKDAGNSNAVYSALSSTRGVAKNKNIIMRSSRSTIFYNFRVLRTLQVAGNAVHLTLNCVLKNF